jgi:hypothetical protein
MNGLKQSVGGILLARNIPSNIPDFQEDPPDRENITTRAIYSIARSNIPPWGVLDA